MRAAAAMKPGAATARFTFERKSKGSGARLEGDAAARVMESKPTRVPPGVILQSPLEAATEFHEDWTRVPGSSSDDKLFDQERKLRETRNMMLHEYLVDCRSVWYTSTGNSMWPMVQSGDACTFHPIQAVTAVKGRHGINKESSEIDVGAARAKGGVAVHPVPLYGMNPEAKAR